MWSGVGIAEGGCGGEGGRGGCGGEGRLRAVGCAGARTDGRLRASAYVQNKSSQEIQSYHVSKEKVVVNCEQGRDVDCRL